MSVHDHPNRWHQKREKAEERTKTSSPTKSILKSTIDLLSSEESTESASHIWFNPELREHEATANLDDQLPATLYYLGKIKDIPQVCEVYVEELENNQRKHWTVLNERDYDVMDEIYDVEEDTLDRFPMADLSFRVTVKTEGGPSIASEATKIFDG